MAKTPCKGIKKDGTPCQGHGLTQYDGYCIAHDPPPTRPTSGAPSAARTPPPPLASTNAPPNASKPPST